MNALIPIINQIQEALDSVPLELGADLPQIAVVGGQSVGKSSLLEALVGRAFLPTGTGVVTRRPLLLQLVNVSPPGSGPEEWGEFQHLPERRIESFDEIREEIARDTDYVCGHRQVISATPIVLKICSPHVIDLTLIDLPGLTKVPVGDQPHDIERQLRELVLDHIRNPRCLILAVVAGNADLATADALAIAREVDPGGGRTLGVVTKLDLADGNIDILAALEGRLYPLQMGFVGVFCRSLKEVQQGRDVREHLKAEDAFFQNHPTLRSLVPRCGVHHLAQRLNRILLDCIRDALPGIKNQALQLIHEYEVELQGYGESVTGRTPSEQGALLLGLFTKFSGRFLDAIEGKLSGQQRAASESQGQLVGRARIDFIFNDLFAATVANFDCFTDLSDNEIRATIRNATGPKAALFLPEAAFELLVKRQISKLEAPSLQCAELVFEELQRVLLLSELSEFRRFVSLRERLFAVVRDILRQCLEPTCEMIRDLVSIELAYINTSHPDFLGGSGALRIAATAVHGGSPQGVDFAGAQPSVGQTTPQASSSVPSAAEPPSGGTGFFSSLGFFSRGVFSGLRQMPVPSMQLPAQATHRPGHGGWRQPRECHSVAAAQSPRLPPVPATILPSDLPSTPRERVEVIVIKLLIDSYLTIVKQNIVDSVPKAVMSFMVNSLREVIQRDCVAHLYKEELFDELLEEAPDMQNRRSRCHSRLRALHRVVEISEQLRDTDVEVP